MADETDVEQNKAEAEEAKDVDTEGEGLEQNKAEADEEKIVETIDVVVVLPCDPATTIFFTPFFPYAKLGGIFIFLFPPIFIPFNPISQPSITCLKPYWNTKGWFLL